MLKSRTPSENKTRLAHSLAGGRCDTGLVAPNTGAILLETGIRLPDVINYSGTMEVRESRSTHNIGTPWDVSGRDIVDPNVLLKFDAVYGLRLARLKGSAGKRRRCSRLEEHRRKTRGEQKHIEV